jgi:hypothetical protein
MEAIAHDHEPVSSINMAPTVDPTALVHHPLFRQAEQMLLCAASHPHHYAAPCVCFHFMHGVPASIRAGLLHIGVEVQGDVLPDPVGTPLWVMPPKRNRAQEQHSACAPTGPQFSQSTADAAPCVDEDDEFDDTVDGIDALQVAANNTDGDSSGEEDDVVLTADWVDGELNSDEELDLDVQIDAVLDSMLAKNSSDTQNTHSAEKGACNACALPSVSQCSAKPARAMVEEDEDDCGDAKDHTASVVDESTPLPAAVLRLRAPRSARECRACHVLSQTTCGRCWHCGCHRRRVPYVFVPDDSPTMAQAASDVVVVSAETRQSGLTPRFALSLPDLSDLMPSSAVVSPTLKCVNLDVTALLALVSDLTNGGASVLAQSFARIYEHYLKVQEVAGNADGDDKALTWVQLPSRLACQIKPFSPLPADDQPPGTSLATHCAPVCTRMHVIELECVCA